MAWCHGTLASLFQRPIKRLREDQSRTHHRGGSPKKSNSRNNNASSSPSATTTTTTTTTVGCIRHHHHPHKHATKWRPEDWVDSQAQLYDMAERIMQQQHHNHNTNHNTNHNHNTSSASSSPSSLYDGSCCTCCCTCKIVHVKVMETFHGPIDMAPLLRVLPLSNVKTLSLVGIVLEESNSRALCRALCDTRTVLEQLQLCRLSQWGVSALATALSFNRSLTELRLTFHHDFVNGLYHFSLLTHAIQLHPTLVCLKLYCAKLHGPASMIHLATMLTHNTTLLECRLTGCNLHNDDLQALACAIRTSNTLQRIDLSMNRISDVDAMAILLETSSLRYINLSENELGHDHNTHNHNNHNNHNNDYYNSSLSSLPTPTVPSSSSNTHLISALANNKTLEYLSLDMNPLSHAMVQDFCQALQYNTTILRICLLTITVSCETLEGLEYLVAMNRAGRGTLRHVNLPSSLMPMLLGAVSAQPTLLYGMLTETPHLWMPSL